MTDQRIAKFMHAKRALDEASEALRRAIEHDLAVTVPDSPDLAALRLIAQFRAETAVDHLNNAMPKPPLSEVDSRLFTDLTASIAEHLRGPW